MITKFFEKEKLERYQCGSFWFGTLKRYRSSERKRLVNAEIRFSDPREGVVEHAINFADGVARDVRIGGLHLTNVSYVGDGNAVQLNHEFNEYLFCASFGRYSLAQHLAIKDGAVSQSGTHYQGNPRLTHYAEIDLLEFLEAIRAVAASNPAWKSSLPMSECMLCMKVSYGDPRKHSTLPSSFESDEIPLTEEDYLRVIFVKPSHFSPENEFRVLLRSDAPRSLQGDPPGLAIVHKRLKRAIKKIDHI